MTAIICTAIICGCALTGWVLWIRIQPRVSRAEFEKQSADIKALNEKMNKVQNALVIRGRPA